MKIDNSHGHFIRFASSLNKEIEPSTKLNKKQFYLKQKNQVETLVKLEKKFRHKLIKHPWGKGIYDSFIKYICDEKGNILVARPYFRERQSIFTKEISKALKKRQRNKLYKFAFNFQFITFALNKRKWPKNSDIYKLYEQICALRIELIETNMPLAISRARIFWSKTPKSQLSYMDMVQISAEGLVSGIDKFVLPFSRVFRAMVIGRILGNLIACYSETLIHFFPNDKRVLYWIRKILNKNPTASVDEVLKQVNSKLAHSQKMNTYKVDDLINASSCVSMDIKLNANNDKQEMVKLADKFSAPEHTQPDVAIEEMDSMKAVYGALDSLSLIERKLLIMKGVNLK